MSTTINSGQRKIVICGDPNWKDVSLINAILRIIVDDPTQTVIIHSGCKGVEKIVGNSARKLGCGVVRVLADWTSYSRFSGPTTNIAMLQHSPDFVIGIHPDPQSSKDTKDILLKAQRAGIPTYLIRGAEDLNSFPTIFNRLLPEKL